MRKRRLALLILFVLALALPGAGLVMATHPSPLPDVITTPNFSYNIRYTNDNPPPASDDNYVSTAQAQNFADALDNIADARLVIEFGPEPPKKGRQRKQ